MSILVSALYPKSEQVEDIVGGLLDAVFARVQHPLLLLLHYILCNNDANPLLAEEFDRRLVESLLPIAPDTALCAWAEILGHDA